MGAQPLIAGVFEGSAIPDTSTAPSSWSLKTLAGRFVEIGGGPSTAGLTLCARLMVEAQQLGGLAVWVGGEKTVFFPPDLADAGVDLAALPVIRVADGRKLWRACDTLLRSGGFSLVVVDVEGDLNLPFGAQTRLSGLAQHHHAVLVALTHGVQRRGVRGSLVSLRAETEKRRVGHDCFICAAHVVKDKRRSPGWTHEELCHGTDGLC